MYHSYSQFQIFASLSCQSEKIKSIKNYAECLDIMLRENSMRGAKGREANDEIIMLRESRIKERFTGI